MSGDEDGCGSNTIFCRWVAMSDTNEEVISRWLDFVVVYSNPFVEKFFSSATTRDRIHLETSKKKTLCLTLGPGLESHRHEKKFSIAFITP